ncbi:16727_t:CDS:1, partial [Cetraspora pellucida]
MKLKYNTNGQGFGFHIKITSKSTRRIYIYQDGEININDYKCYYQTEAQENLKELLLRTDHDDIECFILTQNTSFFKIVQNNETILSMEI